MFFQFPVTVRYMYRGGLLFGHIHIYGLIFSHKLAVKRRYIKAYEDTELTNEVLEVLKQPNRPSLAHIA